MKTGLKETPQSPKRVEQPPHKGQFTREELIEAVKKAFIGAYAGVCRTKGRIDPRYLWSDACGHRFRVNCWSDVAIEYSEFVHVVEEDRKLTVRRPS